MILLCLLLLLVFSAPFIENLTGYNSEAVDLFSAKLRMGENGHILGTDELGRDLLLRLLYGGQISLLAGLAAALCAAVIGSIIGLLAGYYGGWLDGILMRFTDGVIALPLLPLLIVLAAIDLQKLGFPEALAQSQDISLYRIIALIALIGWTTVARLVRGATLAMKEREFVRAATALGAPASRIMWAGELSRL